MDARREIGQFVDREDAAVGSRDEAEVHRRLVGEVPALGVLDDVNLTEQVGDGDVRGRELFVVALVAV